MKAVNVINRYFTWGVCVIRYNGVDIEDTFAEMLPIVEISPENPNFFRVSDISIIKECNELADINR